METLDNAQALINDRLVEIREEEKRLTRALEALTVNKRSGAGKSRPARRRRRVNRSDQVEKIISSKPGQKAAAIAREAKINSSQTHGILKRLADEGKITKAADKTYSPAARSSD